MGGPEAIRGFVIQTIIAIVDTIEENKNWISFTLEPKISLNSDSDKTMEKVDIQWKYPNRYIACQVKSSNRSIELANVINWIRELKKNVDGADEFQLRCIGSYSIAISKLNKKNHGDVIIYAQESLNSNA